jgi:hypothetical protein
VHFHLKLIGILLMCLSLIHLYFPKYFNWSDDLASLSLINRQMMVVHTFFIALVVFLVGLLSFSFPHELIDTKLGKRISLSLGIFWTIRLIFQIFIYSSKHWKGKTFETTIHIVFTILWLYLSFIFLSIGFT